MGNLSKLLFWRGIASNYFNYKGEDVAISLENRTLLLSAMGVDTANDDSLGEQAFSLEVDPWLSWLDDYNVCTEGDHIYLQMSFRPEELDQTFELKIIEENGESYSHRIVPSAHEEVGNYLHKDSRYSKRSVGLAPLPLGYHFVEAVSNENPARAVRSKLVVVPRCAYVPDAIAADERPWGVVVQLYTLRSARNWGIGDFTDLDFMVSKLSEFGVDIVGLNPLHALRTPVQHNCSPYSPSDRRFIEPIYIDPEREPEYSISLLRADLALLRQSDFVEYADVYRAKMDVFNGMYERFSSEAEEGARKQALNVFISQHRDELIGYCLYQALADAGDDLSLLETEDRVVLEQRYKDGINFHCYLQWIAKKQLEHSQNHARECGMSIGLMRDLAVGADSWGAEVKNNRDLFCVDAAVGAPPDPLAEKGQNWGLPPMDPYKLKASHFHHFISLLRHNLNCCGALRIDHAMALMRLWWCPPGKTADFGAYVYYPFEDMIGLLKLESQRNSCLIVGEDMGVVPHEFRQALMDGKIFTNKLFYFEKEHDGCFKAPALYDKGALAMLTNHDVPTLASWWSASDLALRSELDLFEEGVEYEDVLNQRRHEKHMLLDWLVSLELYDDVHRDTIFDEPLGQNLAASILIGGASCASQLFVVQLEDLELMDDPVNVPGTCDEYRNWQRKLSINLEQLFEDQQVCSTLVAIDSRRKS